MIPNQTAALITGSTTEVAFMNANGGGNVIKLTEFVIQKKSADARAAMYDAYATQITALGLTLPE